MKKPRDDEERDEIKMRFFFFTSQIGYDDDSAELIRVGPHESEKSTGDNRQIKSIEWAKKSCLYTEKYAGSVGRAWDDDDYRKQHKKNEKWNKNCAMNEFRNTRRPHYSQSGAIQLSLAL